MLLSDHEDAIRWGFPVSYFQFFNFKFINFKTESILRISNYFIPFGEKENKLQVKYD